MFQYRRFRSSKPWLIPRCGARVADHHFQVDKRLQRRCPGGSRAIGGALAEQQGLAGQFDGDQGRLTVKKDLVGSQHAHGGLGLAVQDGQHVPCVLACLAEPATNGGPTGTGRLGEQQEEDFQIANQSILPSMLWGQEHMQLFCMRLKFRVS